MKVRRIDRGELIPAHRHPDGYLFFDGRATRAGVFTYRNPDGSLRRELRPPDEVGDPESLASMARVPVTDTHPDDFVDADNAKEHAVGAVDGEVIWEQDFADGFVRVKGVVQRADAVASIDGGRRQLSAGYTARLDRTAGVWTDSNGVDHQFDAIQREIRYNHLALVDEGRAGPEVSLRLDAAIQVFDAVQEFLDLPLAPREREWDAAAAEQRVRSWADAEDAPNERYARAFLWWNSDDPESFGSYKLGYADVIDGELRAVPRGLFAVAGVLEGARGGADIPSEDQERIRNVVSRYYAKMRDEFDDDTITPPWEEREDPFHEENEEEEDRSTKEEPQMDQQQQELFMKITIDGKVYDLSEGAAIQRAVHDLEKQRDDAVSHIEEAITDEELEELRKAKAELDVLKADAANREDDGDAETGNGDPNTYANERFVLIDHARRLKLDGFDDVLSVTDSNDEIRRKIVLSRFDENDLPTPEHVDAAWQLMLKELEDESEGRPGHKLARTLMAQQQSRADDDPLLAAQLQYEQSIADLTRLHDGG